MTGPHQSIIARFTSGGQGLPVLATKRIELRSYLARTSAGSASMRTYMVGTR